MLYSFVFRAFFLKLDPEFIHHAVALGLRIASRLGITSWFRVSSKRSRHIQALGMSFPGPFGLAAGFDKNALLVKPLADLGFSHIEIGTVTAHAQPGNPKPRLFRLTKDRALVNRMGFNNDGAAKVAARLAKLRRRSDNLPIIGVNIGKSKITPVEQAADDYRTSTRLLAPVADYFAVNVSSPNTPGLRSLQAVESLEPILRAVLEEARRVPVLVKIAPDLANQDILAVAKLAQRLGLAGIIATNTTITREQLLSSSEEIARAGDGGLSGRPLRERANEVLTLLRSKLPNDFTIISVGGVETASDLKDRMAAGATLVQGYTGFVYQGPLWARNLNQSSWW